MKCIRLQRPILLFAMFVLTLVRAFAQEPLTGPVEVSIADKFAGEDKVAVWPGLL